jgi:hypothetical protein
MSAENVVRSLRVLWRADRIIAEIQLRRMAIGLVARIFAGLFAAFGLLLLEFASYIALVQITTAIVAAVTLAVFNFLLAGAILLIARIGAGGGREHDMAMALHSSAVETLQSQVRAFDAPRASHGLETILPALIVPAIGLVVRMLRKKSSETGGPQ